MLPLRCALRARWRAAVSRCALRRRGRLPLYHRLDSATGLKRQGRSDDPFGSNDDRERRLAFQAALCALGLATLGLIAGRALAASVDPGTLPLSRLDDRNGGIQVDGMLDEPVWANATRYTDFRIINPDSLAPAPYATTMLLLYTHRGIYVGADMEQPADQLVQRLTGRDATRINRDEFSLQLDTSGEGLYGYWMTLALGDNVKDGTILPERRYSRDWDGAWYGDTARTDTGWSAEFFIPWSQMAMPEAVGDRVVGVFGTRLYAARDERWGFPALPRTRATFLSDFQPVLLSDVQPVRQWSLFPYATTTFDRIDDELSIDIGTDIFWRPSSNLQLTASIFPDFGAVEADDVVVNLTALEAFFPERRLFFLEGQEIFTVTPRANEDDNPIILVNTRRIGLGARAPRRADGSVIPLSARQRAQPVDLNGALKLTGQLGKVRYGLLTAFEDDIRWRTAEGRAEQSGSDYGVLRLLYEDSGDAGYRGLGLISTLSDHPERQAQVTGVDGHWQSAGGRWRFDGLALRSDVDDQFAEQGAGYGAFADLTFTPQQGRSYSLGVSAFDDAIELNDLGFLQRNDARRLDLSAQFQGTAQRLVRNYDYTPYLLLEANGDDRVTRAEMGLEGEVTLPSLAEVGMSIAHRPARYDDLNSFGNGTFRIESRSEASLSYETNNARVLSGSVEGIAYQEDLGGWSSELAASLTFRPDAPFSATVELARRWRKDWLLHQGDRNFSTFDAAQWRMSMGLDYFQSARQQLRLSLQWVGIRAQEQDRWLVPGRPGALLPDLSGAVTDGDFGLSNLNLQLRYRWQIAPLSDLFLVYTRSANVREADRAAFSSLLQRSWDEPLGDQLVLKLRYRLGS